MAHFRPKFLKPGEGASGWKEERISASESELNLAIYNPSAAVSLEQQRQKLQIFKNRNHILYLLDIKQTLVLVGETGCGKSTQLPQYLMESGWNNGGLVIGVTEPRRIAVTTLANRVAEEKGVMLGREVGYSIRFDDCYSPQHTKIKFMTEGILLREMLGDPLLQSYSVLVLDEVHERTLYTDILLGLLKKILKKRKDLRLVVASATLDAESFKSFFETNLTKDRNKDTCAIISVEGRSFPVTASYLQEPTPNYVQASIDTVIKIHEKENRPGDILVFLTGQEEVQSALDMLVEYARSAQTQDNSMKLYAFPMYGALSHAEQLKVFTPLPRNVRKVVLATNIAEASITIDGIIFVVDCGFVKLRYFNTITNTDVLVVVPISQASAEQRAGRAGRNRPGKVYRLYREEDFLNLNKETPAEIQRSNLAPVIINLKAMGIDNVLRFSFPAAPPSKNVICALELLYALGALDDLGNLTPLGTQMAEFSIEPMYAKMLLTSGNFGCTEEALCIVAMLQVQNIFIQPYNKTAQARKCKYSFSVEEGDHLTLLNVFLAFIKNNKGRKWCDANFLNYRGLIRAFEIKEQLRKMLQKFKIKIVSCDGDVDAVCRCVVAGFFCNAARLDYTGVYRTIRGNHCLHIHPSSVLYSQKQPQWVIFNEVLQTSKEFMRDITVIEPSWLYELAPHYYQYGTDRELAEKELQWR